MPAPLPPKPLDSKTAALRAARLARDAGRAQTRGDEHHRVFGLRDVLPFRKHAGKTVEDALEDDLDYVTWLMENTHVQFTDEVEQEYRARLDPRRPIRRG